MSDTQQSMKVSTVEQIEKELQNINLQEMPHSMTLTAQELYMLQQAGYEPIQLVFGSIVYSMGIQGLLKSFRRALSRGEMPDFSRMNQDAREIARNRMLKAAKELGASDVIDVILEEHEWSDFLEVVARGVAIKKSGNIKAMNIVVN